VLCRQINRASSWVDGSFVYGRGEVWSNCLREFTGGRLLTTDHLGYYPGYNHLGLPLDNLPDPVSHEKMQPEKQWGMCPTSKITTCCYASFTVVHSYIE